jgi:hypothetical protein
MGFYLKKTISCKCTSFVGILFLAFLLNQAPCFAQAAREKAPPFRDRLFFGGNFGLQFGTVTNIQVAPVVGFWLRPRIAVAAGPEYQYYKDPYYKTNIYGGKGYLEFVVIKNLGSFIRAGSNTGVFLHLEDEVLNLETYLGTTSERVNVNTVLGGAGISQQIGRRSSVNLMFLWVLDDSGYNLYNNPEIRISFSF